MLLILGSDDRYALPLSVTLHSALARIDTHLQVEVLILDGGITDANRSRIERVAMNAKSDATIRWVRPDMSEFSGLRTTHWGSPASYLPLLIPGLAGDADYALYLDSDLLVQSDLSVLWQELDDSPETYVHAVIDYGFHTLGEALKDDGAQKLGLNPEAPYFNSGVLLINLERWRTDEVADRAMEFASNHPDIMRFTDQDALNAVLEGSWTALDPSWNVLVGSIDRLLARSNELGLDPEALEHRLRREPKIMHFSGSQKPWKPGYARLGRRLYAKELAVCGWFDGPRDFRRWRNRMALRTPGARLKRAGTRLVWPLVEKARGTRT